MPALHRGKLSRESSHLAVPLGLSARGPKISCINAIPATSQALVLASLLAWRLAGSPVDQNPGLPLASSEVLCSRRPSHLRRYRRVRALRKVLAAFEIGPGSSCPRGACATPSPTDSLSPFPRLLRRSEIGEAARLLRQMLAA